MNTLISILKLIGVVLVIGLAVAFIIFFGVWFLIAIAAMVGIFGVAWLAGVPITISQNGEKIGYIRWTKFYPTSQK